MLQRIRRLRIDLDNLEYDDNKELDSIRRRADMIARVAFGQDSKYVEDIRSIRFGPIVVSTATRDNDFRRAWQSGVNQLRNVLDTMEEELRLLQAMNEQEEDFRVDADRSLDKIHNNIENSPLEASFKNVALHDLDEARTAYRAEAYKACIVMLGAVLESLMLGTIRRADVLNELQANPPGIIRNIGTQDPNLSDKIATELGFEDYKNTILHLIPEIERLRIDNIQSFRNAIHPWKAVNEPEIYADYDNAQDRAMHYIASLVILSNRILSWTP